MKNAKKLLSKMPVQELLAALKMGLELSFMAPTSDLKQGIESEIELVKAELLVKGIQVSIEHIERDGRKGVTVKSTPIDLLAKAPVKMNIPTPSELINGHTLPELALSQRY